MTDDVPPPKAAMLAALSGAMLLASLGTSIATVALPSLARAFPATIGELQWVVLAYLLTVTVTIIGIGRLGDLYGDRRLLVAGLALFTLASIVCAASTSLALLIAARAVQGVGGAVLMAMPMSIARNAFSADRTGTVMGMLGTMSAIGTALGPSLGGVAMAGFGWQAAFILLTGTGIVAFALAVWAIPALPRVSSGARTGMDWIGTTLLAAGLGLYALATSGNGGGAPWATPSLLLSAMAVLWLFIHSQQRTPSPLVPLALLRDRVICMGLATNLVMGAVMMATLVVGALFLSFGLRLNETQTGLVMAVGPITAALAGVPAGALADRLGRQNAAMIGIAETTIGLVCLALLPLWWGTAGYVAALIVLTPGFQLFLAANNAGVMLAAPVAQRGMVSGLLGLSRNLGLLTGASAMATLFAALIGSEPIAAASTNSISLAFTTVFLVAAGLTLVGAGLTTHGRTLQA